MKSIKRVFAIFLVIMLMATAFAGCGKTEQPQDTPDVTTTGNTDETSTPEPEETPTSTPTSTPTNTPTNTPEEPSKEPSEEPSVKPEEPATETPGATSEPAQTGEVEADNVLGTVEGNTYTNGYFGFTLPIPEGWYVATGEQLSQIINASLEYLNGDSENPTISLAKQMFIPLILIAEQDPSSSNFNLTCTAQNISKFGGLVKDLQTYMNAAVQGLKAQGLEPSGDVEYLNIGGQEFGKISGKQSMAGITFNQAIYCFMKNGFIVMFTLGSTTDEGMQMLEDVMKGITFK